METLQNSFVCVLCNERWPNEFAVPLSDGSLACQGCYDERRRRIKLCHRRRMRMFEIIEESEVQEC
jgi:hypothetical protein